MISVIYYIKNNFDSKQKRLLLITIVVCVLSSIVVSISPAILATIINQVTSGKLLHNSEIIFYFSIGYVFTLSVGRLLPILSNAMLMLLQIDRKLVFSHSFFLYLYNQKSDFFEKHNSGEISQKSVQINNEMHSLFNLIINGFFDPAFKLIIAMVVILLSGDTVVLSLFIIYTILFGISTNYFTKKLTVVKKDLMNAGRDTYKTQIDSVDNMLLAKNNNAFDILFERYRKSLYWERDIAVNYFKYTNKMIILNSFLSVFLLGFCFIYSLCSVIKGNYPIGHFIMITSYIMMLSAPIEILSNNYSQITQATSFLNSFFVKLKNKYPNDTHYIDGKLSSIVISNLSFGYDKGHYVLDNISMRLLEGEFITLTGKSGSGKTTLAKLLVGSNASYSGNIFIADKDINSYSDYFLKDKIYIVSQDDFIFMDTLRFNLLISKPDATDEELLRALELACFYNPSEISTQEKENLLDIKMGNRGSTISGGQQQRISLARLFLRKPDIIIIDESTSSLDLINEKRILDNVVEKFPNAIKISISHRPTTFRYSNRIFILDEGKVSDSGSLEELLSRNAYMQNIMKDSLL